MEFSNWSIPEGISFDIVIAKLPLKRKFRTSFGEAYGTRVFLLSRADECIGIGEAPVDPYPLYSGEFVESVVEFAKKVLPEVKAQDTVSGMYNVLRKYRGNNFAKAMIEYSILTLVSCLTNTSLVKAVGGRPFALPVQESIGIVDSVDELLKWAEEAISWGARRLKVKIEPGWDVEPVKALSREFPGVPILADANGSFSPLKDSHWEILSEVAQYVNSIEQPFPPGDLVNSAKLSYEEAIEVTLDESVTSPNNVVELATLNEEMGSFLSFNLKPPRMGGLMESLKSVELAQQYDIPLFIGGSLETAVGRSLNMVVASTVSKNLEPSDFSPDQYFYERSLAKDPFDIECGFVRLRDGIGVMFDIDIDYLMSRAIEKISM
ncbi:hypothetical protein EYM_00915 [Ignicoccus islandicus DSM 13165]|uniref:Mandelate racemase/muconate lactonizing enzyme C-terminal domain-containing protein n=1 Tax=Ignicoccus islandicus DSM 13165 TaxID=940295 RepID=A0A0U3E2K7_9CREN|nr:enolase C-terminal domain-like protein [Ignicoccus islandicus]ALU12155.1 hypothetical protein EYM_00915 [Ignicoccus islandicus DSM 13165]